MTKPGHGDHWLAVLDQADPRLRDAVAPPLDAPDALRLTRSPLTESADMVQVTARRRLLTAYPEPRATALVEGKPRALGLWDTRVEGWLTLEHEGAGALTLFPTDLAQEAVWYQSAGTRRGLALEVGAIAYTLEKGGEERGPPRLEPAARVDERFLPDDYWMEGLVRTVHPAGAGEVLDVEVQGGLAFPVACREATGVRPGEHVVGIVWLTGRRPQGR